jgi:hypothetical protein
MVLLLGEPSGDFVAPITVQAGDDPQSVLLTDIDADDDLDIITANFESDTLSIIRNLQGTLSAPIDIDAGKQPRGIASADLDGDHDMDLVVGHSDTGFPTTVKTVSVLSNAGDGRFTKTADFEAGSAPFEIVAADLENDGFPDIIAGGVFDYVAVFRNEKGAYAPREDITINGTSGSIAVGDIDGDGDLDLAVANGPYSYEITVLRNRGNATFDSTEMRIAGNTPLKVALADLEPDGDLDIVVLAGEGRIVVALNFGAGEFGQPIVNDLAVQAGSSAMDDIDRDGDPDLLVVTSGLVAVLRYSGGGIFTANDFLAAGGTPNALAVAQVIGDAGVELVTTDTGLDRVLVTANLTRPSTSEDCNADQIPDECELSENDCDRNAVPDDCQADSDMDTVPDRCDFCACDCDADHAVVVHELLQAVQLSLDDMSLEQCPAADVDFDGAVRIADLVAGVQRALNGCN